MPGLQGRSEQEVTGGHTTYPYQRHTVHVEETATLKSVVGTQGGLALEGGAAVTPSHSKIPEKQRYERYIQSPAWKKKRAAYFASQLPQGCQGGCGRKEHLHLHHRTYERFGMEELSDLVPLCEECHALVHAMHREYGGDLAQVTDRTLAGMRRANSNSTQVQVGKSDPVNDMIHRMRYEQRSEVERPKVRKLKHAEQRAKYRRLVEIEKRRNEYYRNLRRAA